MKISDMVAKMTGGLARTNRYSVILSVPISGDNLAPLQDLMLYCDQVQLPGLSVQTSPNRIYGEVRETPYEFNYEPINLSFYVDSSMNIKYIFDQWIQSIQNGDSRTFKYYNEYICPQMHILVQDVAEKSKYQVTLYEVYPKSVSPVQMDYASKDVMKLNVSFTYKNWKSVLISEPVQQNSQEAPTDIHNVQSIPDDSQVAAEEPSNDSKPFGKAFREARNAGLKEFTWRGNRYHTKYKEEM
jgi:hypothetical protein